MAKRYIVQPGQKATVEINRGKVRSPKSQVLSPKGIIKLRREDDFLPRRLFPGWQFWFEGARRVDAELENNLFVAPSTHAIVADDVTSTDIDPSDIEAKNDSLLTETNLEKTFEQIEPENAELYLLRIRTNEFDEYLTEDHEWWKKKSVKYEADAPLEWLRISGDPFFAQVYIDFRDDHRADGCKVTEEPSFDASEVMDFAVKKSAKFFLTPSFGSPFLRITGQKSTPQDRGDVFTFTDEFGVVTPINLPYSITQQLLTDYFTFPRIDLESHIEFWRANFFSLIEQTDFTGGLGITEEGYQLLHDLTDFALQFGTFNYTGLSGYYSFYDEEGSMITLPKFVLEEAAYAFPNPSLYPAPPTLPDENSYGTPIQINAFWNSFAVAGDLRAVIKQSGKTYYVWERE